MILKIMRILLVLSCTMLSLLTFAQSNTTNSLDDSKATTIKDETLGQQNLLTKESVENNTIQSKEKNMPKVGKHVMANMNPGSMILSLFLVLGLIIVCALILKRFNLTQQGVNSQLKVISTLNLGSKERLIVVQVGEQQLLLGVTNQQITLLETLAVPLTKQTINTGDLPKNILSFLASKKDNG